MRNAIVLAIAVVMTGCVGSIVPVTTGTVCENVDCGARGQCIEVNAAATCDCDDGYHAEGLTCVEDTILPPGPKTISITQFGVTWTFDKEYEYGQFENGDYWVVGPITVMGITPSWTGQSHGSMINPIPPNQAYDSRRNNFNASLLVTTPKTIPAGSSLVSARCWTDAESGSPDYPTEINGVPRPTLRTAAVLTILETAPPTGSFRPPYVGTDKPLFSASSLRKDLLPQFSPAFSVPDVSEVAQGFERVWLDHFSNAGGETQYTSPTENMPSYGREYSIAIGNASLMLMLNQGIAADILLVRFVQLGIDLYYAAQIGGFWWPGGGLNHGRKWPILFAGTVLDHAGMKAIGSFSKTMTDLGFQEDCQTFSITQTEVDITNSPQWSPDTRGPIAPYELSDIGLPEWGIEHCTRPWFDNQPWGAIYRQENSMSYSGIILSALMLGQKSAWDHDALFEYTDRWVVEYPYSGAPANEPYYRYGGAFAKNMWQTYRANYGPAYAPSSLTATAVSTAQIDLTWQANANNHLITGYHLYRSADGGKNYSLIQSTPAAQTSFFDTGLTANTRYHYRVKAYDDHGESYPAVAYTVTLQ